MKFLLLFLSSLFYCYLNAQTVKHASKNIDNSTFDFLKIAGQDDDGFFLLQSNISFDTDRDKVGFKSRKYKITYYDFELNEKWNRVFAKKDDDIPVENIAFGNGELILCYTEINFEKDAVTIFTYSLSGKNKLSEKFKIAELNFTDLSELDKIKIAVSHDKTKYAFIQNEIKKDDTQTLHVVITENNFQTINTSKTNINYPEKNFYFEGWILSDKGDFAFLGSNYTKEKFTPKKKWVNYLLYVAKYNQQSGKEYSLNTNNLMLDGNYLTYDFARNDIIISGFYTERPPGSSGLFIARQKLDADLQPDIKKQSISEGEKAKLQNTETIDSNPYQLLNYTIEKVILRSDGGAVIIAEASYTSEFSYYDYFSQTYLRRLEYHFENAATFSVNADGTIHWNTVLRKTQVSTDDYGVYSSFIPAITEEKINFIYNNDLDKSNAVKLFTVSKDGKSEEKSITKPEDRVLIIPGSGKQVSENEIVIPCWQRKNLTLIKITL